MTSLADFNYLPKIEDKLWYGNTKMYSIYNNPLIELSAQEMSNIFNTGLKETRALVVIASNTIMENHKNITWVKNSMKLGADNPPNKKQTERKILN